MNCVLKCGHNIDIPDECFASEPGFIVPCPKCGKKYIIDRNGKVTPMYYTGFKFPSLHY